MPRKRAARSTQTPPKKLIRGREQRQKVAKDQQSGPGDRRFHQLVKAGRLRTDVLIRQNTSRPLEALMKSVRRQPVRALKAASSGLTQASGRLVNSPSDD